MIFSCTQTFDKFIYSYTTFIIGSYNISPTKFELNYSISRHITSKMEQNNNNMTTVDIVGANNGSNMTTEGITVANQYHRY